ncbi:MAG: hypothetical protein KBT73_05825 [Marinobacter sp.]|nr:hypothetical protein [Marinobacter sp.]
MRLPLLIIVLALITGCAHQNGVQVSRDEANKIIIGKTSKSEVIELLGQPNGSMLGASEGSTESFWYNGAEAKANPALYIPIVGMFFGGIDSKGSSLIISFDEKGVVTERFYSEMNSGSSRSF